MSSTSRKAGKRSQNGSIPTAPTADSSDILTLSEAATYLRSAEEEVLRLAELRELPGRQIGGEWRFLKTSLQDWLRTPPRMPGKEAFLALAGAWRDDPDVEPMVRDAHRRRGRPGAEREE